MKENEKEDKKTIKNTTGWSPFVGCKFDCIYCNDSYKPILRRFDHGCQQCHDYAPHTHPTRIPGKSHGKYLKPYKLPSSSVLFVAENGDISFCDPVFVVNEIINAMREDKKQGRVFLLQSKNPAYFAQILHGLPQNVVLMTTIESNRHYPEVSKAPPPSQRFQEFLQLDWPRKAMVMEPILKFDLKTILDWATELKPEAVLIGLESKRRCTLPEPTPSEIEELHRELRNLGFKTYDKATFKYLDVF